MLLCATLPLAAQTFWDGTADKNFPGEGTEMSPYLISTPEQLAGLAARVNDDGETFEGKFLKLTQDMYLTDLSQEVENRKEWTPIGGVFYSNYSTDPNTGNPIGPKVTEKSFSGHFDGDGHTIYNQPSVTIEFRSNGGTEVASRLIEAGSKILPPTRPKRDGYIFVAWCKDKALTQPITFNDAFTESTTLYAKWIENTLDEYDMTPFQNEFATTFHIKNKAQLRGFAMAVNGVYDFTAYLADPYAEITTISAPIDFTGKKVVLDNDIELNDITDWQLWGQNVYAEPWIPIGMDLSERYGFDAQPFTGTFDGQGHTISGMYIELDAVPSAMAGNWGLFGQLGGSAVVKNVAIVNSVLNGQPFEDGAFRPKNCSTQCLGQPGLLAGSVYGPDYSSRVTISNCAMQGKIIVVEPNLTPHPGGLISWVDRNASIDNCYAIVDIEGGQTGSCGLVGYVNTSTSSVNISNSYSAGHTYYGLAGNSPQVTSSYFNKELVTEEYNYPYHVYAGTGKTTAEMKQRSTYEGWDFETVWGISSAINDGYPFLRVFYPDAKEDAVLTTTPTAVAGLVYTGEPLTLVTAGAAEGGEVQYALSADGEFSAELPTATYPGDYTVYYKVVGDDSHNSLPIAGPIIATINKAAGVISFAESSMSKTYGDADFTNTLTNTGDGTVTYTSNNENIAIVNSETGEVTFKGAGTATIKATVVDGTNYTYATKTAQYTMTVETASGISDVKTDPAEKAKWYDLSGRPLNGEPTQAGVYVKNGKKVVIK